MSVDSSLGGSKVMPAEPALHPPDETLAAYGLGKLTDTATADAVMRHLESCRECRRRLAEMPSDSFLRRVRDAVGNSGGTEPPQKSLSGVARSITAPQKGEPDFATASGPIPPELTNHPDYEVVRELGR